MFIYILTTFSAYFSEFGLWNVRLVYYFALYASGLIALVFELKRIYREAKRPMILIGLFVFSTLVNDIFINDKGLIVYVDLASEIGIGLLLVRNKNRHLFAGLILLLFFIVFNHVIIHQGSPVNILYSRSGNHISAMNLALFGMYFLSIETQRIYKKHQFEVLIIAVVVTLTNVLAFGRGGILSSLVLLYGTTIYYFISKPKLLRVFYFIVVPLVIFFLFYQYYDVILGFTKFSEAGLESSRPIHWQRFIVEIQRGNIFKNLFIGMPLDSYMSEYKHSLHNSFTELVFLNGVGTLIVIYMMFYSIIKNLKRNYIILAFCILAITLRSVTDVIIIDGNNFTFSLIIAFYITTHRRENYFKRNVLPIGIG